MKIVNYDKQIVIAGAAVVADTFFSRLKGLLGQGTLAAGAALIITPCNSVHTIGMKFAIDVVFVDKQGVVRKIVAAMAPGKIAFCRGSSYVVELPAGTLEATHTQVGDMLVLQ